MGGSRKAKPPEEEEKSLGKDLISFAGSAPARNSHALARVSSAFDADLSQPVVVAGADHDRRFAPHGHGRFGRRLDELHAGGSIGDDFHLVDPRLRVGVSPCS